MRSRKIVANASRTLDFPVPFQPMTTVIHSPWSKSMVTFFRFLYSPIHNQCKRIVNSYLLSECVTIPHPPAAPLQCGLPFPNREAQQIASQSYRSEERFSRNAE